MKKIPVALTVAGSDSSGGAGIQADIKVFSEFAVYSMAVITSLTAQNTFRITKILNTKKDLYLHQLERCLEDIKPDAFKTGMLPSPFMPEILSELIDKYKLKNFVLDPVMLSKTGVLLTEEKTIKKTIKYLFPRATVITPNIPEAEFILKTKIKDEKDMIKACKLLLNLGPEYVLLKGGHLHKKYITDIFYGKKEMEIYRHTKINTKNTHGSGCSLSAAITALLAKGYSHKKAVKHAITYIHNAIKYSLKLGKGHGPLNHFWRRRHS